MRYGATKPTLRGFSPAQQGYFRPLVDQAWAAHCKRDAGARDAVDKAAARRAWYEAELFEATGKKSSSYCDRKRDFTNAMVHFEQIVGESIFWATRKYGDDARRIAWNIQEVCRENEVEEDYMRGCLRNALRLGDDWPLPRLEDVPYDVLIIIMGELKRFLRRGGMPGVKQGKEPF